MLWELSVSEQRYRAVLEVMAGVPVTEATGRAEVLRQPPRAVGPQPAVAGNLPSTGDRARQERTAVPLAPGILLPWKITGKVGLRPVAAAMAQAPPLPLIFHGNTWRLSRGTGVR